MAVRAGVDIPNTGHFWGHPKGVFLVTIVEMWERFSYYGMMGLLVLFLTAAPVDDGFGWDRAAAIKLYGMYSGLVFVSPAIGGWLSSYYLGERKCILIGGLSVALGHLFLAGPAYFPELVDMLAAAPVEQMLNTSDPVYGRFSLSEPEWSSIRQKISVVGEFAARQDELAFWIKLSYTLKSWSFIVGLALIVAGTGFIKATVSSIVGKLYAENDSRRDTGFTIFMVGIWIGSFLSSFIAGTLGEKMGWHWGLGIAGVAMAVGISIYLIWHNRILGNVGCRPDRRLVPADSDRTSRLNNIEVCRLFAMLTMSAFTIIYAVAFYQKGGLIHLMIQQSVDRTVGSFEIPATWFLAISTGGFIILAPLVARGVDRLSAGGITIDVVQKQATGLAAMAVAYVFLFKAAQDVQMGGSSVSMWWFVCAYVFFAIGDIFVWPPQISVVGRYAPPRLKSFYIGAWYVTVGLGTYVSGYVGAFGYEVGVPQLFRALLLVSAASSVALILLRAKLQRLLDGPMGDRSLTL